MPGHRRVGRQVRRWGGFDRRHGTLSWCIVLLYRPQRSRPCWVSLPANGGSSTSRPRKWVRSAARAARSGPLEPWRECDLPRPLRHAAVVVLAMRTTDLEHGHRQRNLARRAIAASPLHRALGHCLRHRRAPATEELFVPARPSAPTIAASKRPERPANEDLEAARRIGCACDRLCPRRHQRRRHGVGHRPGGLARHSREEHHRADAARPSAARRSTTSCSTTPPTPPRPSPTRAS